MSNLPPGVDEDMDVTIDANKACEKIGAMWLRLGDQISAAIPDIVIADEPEKAIRWARCAEACFWQATGEAESNDVKGVISAASNPEGAKG